jgi:uracil-DNA glycosylase family 4
MRGSGEWNCPILFIGEAPGGTEDEPPAGVEPQPFIGKAGKILRDAIDVADYEDHEYGFTNVVRCRPPDNRTPKSKEIQACSQFLVDEIEERNPYVVVLLGATALSAVLGESGITQYNGVVIERDDRVYIPMFHPSYFNYGGRDKLDEWFLAVERALHIAREGSKDYQPASDDWEIIIPRTVDDIREMAEVLRTTRDDHGPVSYDIEAQWLSEAKAGNRVLSVSFGSIDDRKAWSIPIDHDESWWTEDEIEYILDMMYDIMSRRDVIGHHIRFDTKLTRALLGIDCKPAGCTMLVSQLLDAVPGRHGLKRLAGLHLGMYDYDKELEDYKAEHPECDYKKGGHYGNVPLSLLLPYGAKDAIATSELYPILEPKMTYKQSILYHQVIAVVDRDLGFMEQSGFLLDKDIVDRYVRVYTLLVKEQQELILQDWAVAEYTRMRQTGEVDQAVAARLVKAYSKANKPPKFIQYLMGEIPEADVKKVIQPKFKFNPNSSEQMNGVLYGVKGFAVPHYTETGNPSVGMDQLKLSDEIVEDEIFEPYRLWKLYAGMVSKYLAPPLRGEWDFGDDRVRVHFNIGGASTGRLSSSDPTNLQNIPTPEKEPGTVLAHLPIKNIFQATWYGQVVSPTGRLERAPEGVMRLDNSFETIMTGDTGCLYAADFSSMELRIMASVSGCQGMIDVFLEGLDPHCYVTRQVFRDVIPADADDKTIKTKYKTWRYRAKWTNWTLLFGGDEYTLHNTYRLPIEEARAIVKAYYERFPEILEFQEDTKRFLKANGFVESPLGRRLHLPDIYDKNQGRANKAQRTGVNMPIQGTASDILLMAIIIIGKRMRADKMKSLLVNTVHDSVVQDVYPGELFALKDLCEDSMENVVTYAPQYFPDVDLSWLRVPLKADGEVGTHYGALEECHA